MKITTCFFMLGFALIGKYDSGTLSAQQSGPKTVFWEISGNGVQSPSYLFGTIHIIPKDDFIVHKEVEKKLKNSKRLIMEMDLNIPLKQKIEMAKLLLLEDGKTLKDFLDEREYSFLKAYVLDSLGIKPSRFSIYEKMKPFAFYSALVPSIIGEKTESYEMYFSKLAKKKKIPVSGLETFEFQLAIFDSIPIEKQIDMFFDFSEDPRVEFEKMVTMYKDQDIYMMGNSLTNDEKYKHFEEELKTKRNFNWVEQFGDILKEGSCFIAVGAAHLAGKHGLIELLEEKGYVVKAVIL
jgi:uncharacterized protein